MLCESCGEYEANVHLTHVINGAPREIHVCEECAAKSGINVHGPLSLSDLLMGLGALEDPEPGGPEKTCPYCKLTLSEMKKNTRLGCAACYEVFGSELKTILAGMQGDGTHVGKVPHGVPPAKAVPVPVAALEKALEAAVAREDYEEAARLRDQIRKEKTAGEPAVKT